MGLQRFDAVTDSRDKSFKPEASGWVDDFTTSLKTDALFPELLDGFVPRRQVKLSVPEVNALRRTLKAKQRTLQGAARALRRKISQLEKQLKKHPAGAHLLQQKISALKLELEANGAQATLVQQAFNGAPRKRKWVDDANNIITVDENSPVYGSGKEYRIQLTSGTKLDPITQGMLWSVEEKLGSYYYKLLNGGQAVQCTYKSEVTGKDVTVDIFQKLTRLGAFDAMDIAAADVTVAQQMGLMGAPPSDILQWQFPATLTGRAFVWVPKSAPLFFLDSLEPEYSYAAVQGKWVRSAVPKNCLACYKVTGKKDDPVCQVEVFFPKISGSQSGGGGAMRADRVADEVDFWWTGLKEVGDAIGLPAMATAMPQDLVLSPVISALAGAATDVAVSQSLPHGMKSGMQYARRFKTAVDHPPKKNLPRVTFPLVLPQFSIKDDAKNFGGSNLQKKRKGDWGFQNGPFRTGESLRARSVANRLDAKTVMGKAFAEVHLASCDGPATEFAKVVIEPNGAALDASAVTAWATMSQGVRPRPASPDPHGLQKQLVRTDQEWCHLLGHGDGGDETLENFVSGSKHCNTEQLAIETAQRTGSPPGLRAKITAYLVPSLGKPKAILRPNDIALLGYLKDGLFDPTNVPACIATAEGYFKKPTPSDFITLLPANKKNWVPSAHTYGTMGQSDKDRTKKLVLEELRNAVWLPLPLASVIRYKLYNPGGQKIFDHFFWAQKESFDLNEFNILYWTVRRVVAAWFNMSDEYASALKFSANSKKAWAKLDEDL
ncbi:MAG: hypothetical protein M3Y50_15195 [Acidobacteriota bacterium]|nr:hypothetical protein [Acidobacteriota bacterium]